jgi:hypothetical protein
MRIALFISGRITCYESCLLPFLHKSPHEVHLYISLNADPVNQYVQKSVVDLKQWLRGSYIHPFTLPENFVYTHPETQNFQFVKQADGTTKLLPIHQMSMYFNDWKAMQMIIESGETYDLVMKFRADMMNVEWPLLPLQIPPPMSLHMVKPNCHFPGFGESKKFVVSDCWVWGRIETMSLYCETYPFVLSKLEEKKGNYLIHYESCVTDNVCAKGLCYEFFPYKYILDKSRRALDSLVHKKAPLLPTTGR